MSAETLRNAVRQSRVDAGQEKGVTTEQAALIRELKPKYAEFEQTVAILKAATTLFARKSDPLHRWSVPSFPSTESLSGSLRLGRSHRARLRDCPLWPTTPT